VISRTEAILIAGLLAVLAGRAWAASSFEARVAIEELASAGEYSAAVKLEESLFNLVIEEFGETSVELAEAYMFMASLYAADRNRFMAEDRILTALELYERADGPLSTLLIEPFVALGDHYFRANEFDLALNAYNEARILGRRAYGLLNREQIAVLDKMSDATLALGLFDEADALKLDTLAVVQRAYGEDSLENLDAHFEYVEWLSELNRFRTADNEFYRIARIIREQFDNDPRLQIRLFRADARNFRRANETLRPQFVSGRGQFLTESQEGLGHRSEPGELLAALELYDEFEFSDPLLRAELLVELGDWHVHYNRTWAIDEAYQEAWNVLSLLENGDELKEEFFSDLTVVRAASLSSRVLTSDEDAPWGHLKLEFTINTDGTVDDFVVLESEPEELIDDAAIAQMQNSRFRPRIQDGVLVPSKGVVAWDYQYRAR
jgi:TonB family protein